MLVRKGKHFKKYFKTFTYWAKGGKRKEDLQKKKKREKRISVDAEKWCPLARRNSMEEKYENSD